MRLFSHEWSLVFSLFFREPQAVDAAEVCQEKTIFTSQILPFLTFQYQKYLEFLLGVSRFMA